MKKTNEVEPRIYVAGLSDYNAGILHGEWIELDGKSIEDVQAEISAILAASPYAAKYGEKAEEWAIHDYELGGMQISEYENLENLVAISQCLSKWGKAFTLYVAYVGSVEYAKDNFEEAYLGKWDSFRDFAESEFNELYMHDIPEHLQSYIDYDKVERDLSYDYYESDGHIFRTDV